MSFNPKALQHLVDNPSGKIYRHVRMRTEQLTASMRETGFHTQKKGYERIPVEKFEEIIQNQPVARPSSFEIGIPRDQVMPPQPGEKEKKPFGHFLADKALKEKGHSWINKAFAKNRHFKSVR